MRQIDDGWRPAPATGGPLVGKLRARAARCRDRALAALLEDAADALLHSHALNDRLRARLHDAERTTLELIEAVTE